uniref:Transposase n=1 Tax=Ditylenchus dipsaci TaxID=166011 RepID=A0A915EBE1_9BILA
MLESSQSLILTSCATLMEIAQQHHHRDSQEYVKQRLEAEAIQEDFARGDDLREVQPAGPPGGGEDIHEVGGGGSHPGYQPVHDEGEIRLGLRPRQEDLELPRVQLSAVLNRGGEVVQEPALDQRPDFTSRPPPLFGLVLHRFYKEMKNKSKEKLSMITSLSFTTDIWSGPTESFISLTAHGINHHWERIKEVLCVRPFPGSHNSENISDMIITMMEEWDVLREQVHVVVRDEGANIKKAMENTGYDHLNCAAHMLNLVVKNSITEDTELMELLQKCRSLVAHFRHSNLACERLREEQEREETPLHQLKQAGI